MKTKSRSPAASEKFQNCFKISLFLPCIKFAEKRTADANEKDLNIKKQAFLHAGLDPSSQLHSERLFPWYWSSFKTEFLAVVFGRTTTRALTQSTRKKSSSSRIRDHKMLSLKFKPVYDVTAHRASVGGQRMNKNRIYELRAKAKMSGLNGDRHLLTYREAIFTSSVNDTCPSSSCMTLK